MRTGTSRVTLVAALALIVPAASNAAPDTLWTRVYDPNGAGGSGRPIRLVADTSGTYVFGFYAVPGISVATVKYTNTAELAWSHHRTGDVSIEAVDVALHPAGGVVACGTGLESTGTRYEIDVMRYRSDSSVEWEYTYYDDSFSLRSTALAVDNAGNVLVAGVRANWLGDDDLLLLKLGPTGGVSWLATFDGADSGRDAGAKAVAVDRTGNSYVGGTCRELYRSVACLVKFNAIGDTEWSRYYASPDTETSEPVAVAVEPNGDVTMMLTARIGTSSPYMALCTYSATGAERWTRHWRSPDGRPSNARALAVDSSGFIYATGAVVGGPTSTDVVTVKYTSDGDTAWSAWYVGEEWDNPIDLALAPDGSFYVCGSGDDAVGDANVMMLHFDRDGGTLWKHLLGWGSAAAVAVSPAGQLLAAAELRPTPNPPPDIGLVAYTETGAPHDVGCSRVVSPSGRIDTGSVVVPACSVYNYGTLVESYQVRLRIATGYDEAVTVSDHSPQTAREVRFPEWTVGAPGSYAVTCSTECVSDPHPENDARRTTVEVSPPAVGETGLTFDAGPYVLRQTLHRGIIHIAYTVEQTAAVRLTVLDAAGRTIRTLVSATAPSGNYETTWDRTDASGRAVNAGVHYLRLTAGGRSVTRKLVLVD